MLKSAFRYLPKLILCTLAVGICAAAFGYFGNHYLNEKETVGSPVMIDIAVVLSLDDPQIAFAYQMMQNMDGIDQYCTFHIMDYDEAVAALSRKEVAAVAVIPDGFIESINNGTNLSATLILPQNAGIETLFFTSVIDAGSRTLAYIESGIYAVDRLLRAYELRDYVAEAEAAMNDLYLKFSLNRNTFFQKEYVSSTEGTTTVHYYTASCIVLLILLNGLVVFPLFQTRAQAQTDALSLCRIRTGYQRFCEYLSAFALFFVLFGFLYITVCTVGKKYFHVSFLSIVGILFLILSVMSYIMCIRCVSGNELFSTLFLFLSTVFMFYVCGRIVPSSYLPQSVGLFGAVLPVRFWCSLTESVLTGQADPASLCAASGYTVFFYAAAIAASLIRTRQSGIFAKRRRTV